MTMFKRIGFSYWSPSLALFASSSARNSEFPACMGRL